MNHIELPIDNQRWYLLAAFGIFIALVVIIMALNFRIQPSPPITANVSDLECVDLSSSFHAQDGWKRVHAADEYRVISLTMIGKAEWQWFRTMQCWEAARPANRFLLNQMWWRVKK